MRSWAGNETSETTIGALIRSDPSGKFMLAGIRQFIHGDVYCLSCNARVLCSTHYATASMPFGRMRRKRASKRAQSSISSTIWFKSQRSRPYQSYFLFILVPIRFAAQTAITRGVIYDLAEMSCRLGTPNTNVGVRRYRRQLSLVFALRPATIDYCVRERHIIQDR